MRQPRESEQEFLARYDASRFPHPSVAVDVALLTVHDGALVALGLRRSEHPFLGAWSLPGVFVGMEEPLDDAAVRALGDKVGVRDVFVEQLYTFGAPGRDPRTRVITVAYYALVDHRRLVSVVGGRDGLALVELVVPWEGEGGGAVAARSREGGELPLAFDHADILGMVVKRLRGKLDYANIGFELLPARFTLRDLQRVHETIHGRALNKDSFRRRMLASGLVVPTGEREEEAKHRPAELYRFER